MRKCKKCKYFRIVYEPIWDSDDIKEWGKARCKKYNLKTHYRNGAKIERLSCVEGVNE